MARHGVEAVGAMSSGAKGPGTTALGSASREAVPRPVDSGFGVELPLAPSVTTHHCTARAIRERGKMRGLGRRQGDNG